MSELDFDWGNLSAPPPKPKKTKTAPPPAKVSANVVLLDQHRCERKHKTPDTFIKCALRRYNYNIQEKAALPEITVKGSGIWATVHESLSEIYASYSYETETEYLHQFQILEVILFETLEEAAEWQQIQRRFCQTESKCSAGCNSVGMWGYVTKIVM